MKKRLVPILGCILIVVSVLVLTVCLNPVEFTPVIPPLFPNEISFTDVTAAVLMLTNRSKTVDVTNVTITQPEWAPSEDDSATQPHSISFANKPRRLEKKAQYLAPSDKNYQVVIDYAFDAWNDKPAGTGSQTLTIPLPLAKQIVEFIIYRDKDGVVIVDKETTNPDPSDMGNPEEDPSIGEGSSPAIIPPEYRNKVATFVVVSKTNSQTIDSVNFKMGDSSYTMGRIGIHDKQSIALGQGGWETRLKFTRNGTEKVLGPLNSIIVPSNDPQAIHEHYLYFYLNKKGDYAISQTWPPFPDDVEEEDILPPDNGNGRGLIKIINQSYAIAEMVTIYDLRDVHKFPMSIDYGKFTPPIPIQYNKTGYVDVIGTSSFPIEAHEDYLVQVTLETSESNFIVERKAYLKDQVITIVITGEDTHINNAQGANFKLTNAVQNAPVDIISLIIRNNANAWQSSYFGTSTWNPQGDIGNGKDAKQMVMSTTAMPITPTASFIALVTIHGGGISTTITKTFGDPILYSNTATPDQNIREIVIDDSDVPQSIITNTRGAKVTIQNNTNAYPVQITGMKVQNKSNNSQNMNYGSSTWDPKTFINSQASAEQMVMHSSAMPITAGAQFEAVIYLYGNGKPGFVTKPFSPTSELYSTGAPSRNLRTVAIDDNDVPIDLRPTQPPTGTGTVGAKVTIKNMTDDYPVQVIGMTIQNMAHNDQNTVYGTSTWKPIGMIGKGSKADQLVLNSDDMPITAADEFEAIIVLSGNNQVAEVTKNFSQPKLYSTTPNQNLRTITINDIDVPTNLRPTDPTDPTDPITKPDIGGANNGDTVEIDGIEWIKVRTDPTNSNLVLLMLKGVTGPCVKYNDNGNILEYGSNPSIKGYVDTWYAALNAPTLKKIAWQVNFGTTPSPSWPGNGPAGETNYIKVAFIPRLSDIGHLMKANNHRYWLSDINQHPTILCWYHGIIQENGDYVKYGASANSSSIYVRPCIWVNAKF